MPFEPWTVLNEQRVFANRWVEIRLQQVRLPDGREYEYSLVNRPTQGVAVLLFDDAGRLLLEQEYRHAIGQVVWQLPGGLINDAEAPRLSAERELREETGYEAESWRELGFFYDNPALGNACSLLYVARGARHVADPAWDEAEAVELHWVELPWLRQAIRDNLIVDRVVLSGLAMLWAQGGLDGAAGTPQGEA